MKFFLINLDNYFNNRGFSSKNFQGNFTGAGSSYPGEQLKRGRRIIHQTPFLISNMLELDNIEFYNQSIEVESNFYENIHILGSSDNGSFTDEISLYYNDILVDTVSIKLSEWILNEPVYNEKVAFKFKYLYSHSKKIESIAPIMWYQVVNLDSDRKFNRIEFPDNACMHIFSLTLEKRGEI